MGDIQSETKFGFKLNGKLYITNYLRHTEFYTMRHTKYVFLPYLNPTQAIWFPNNRVGTRCNDERNKLLFSHKWKNYFYVWEQLDSSNQLLSRNWAILFKVACSCSGWFQIEPIEIIPQAKCFETFKESWYKNATSLGWWILWKWCILWFGSPAWNHYLARFYVRLCHLFEWNNFSRISSAWRLGLIEQ